MTFCPSRQLKTHLALFSAFLEREDALVSDALQAGANGELWGSQVNIFFSMEPNKASLSSALCSTLLHSIMGPHVLVDLLHFGCVCMADSTRTCLFQDSYDTVVALRVTKLDLAAVPFLAPVLKKSKTDSVSLEAAVFYFANHDKNVEGTEFKASTLLWPSLVQTNHHTS